MRWYYHMNSFANFPNLSVSIGMFQTNMSVKFGIDDEGTVITGIVEGKFAYVHT